MFFVWGGNLKSRDVSFFFKVEKLIKKVNFYWLRFCKITKHDLVQFDTEVYYQKCCYLYQSNVYILFN